MCDTDAYNIRNKKGVEKLARRVEKVIDNYSERDFQTLLSIYNYRCLSMNQLFNLHYRHSKNKEVTPEYLRKKILKMKKDNLIEEVKCVGKKTPTVFFLTNDGIQAVKIYFNLSSNIYDTRKRIHERGYYTCSEVRVADRFIPHQYNLNQFALTAGELLKYKDINYSYVDERHVSQTYGIRPDGILSTLGLDIFLEMDMGTESLQQLKEKWNHYRSYLNSQSYIDNGKKIVIFFICYNKGKVNDRIKVIKNSLNEHFIDCLKEVEVYVGLPEKLMSVMKNILIPFYTTGKNEMYDDLILGLKKHSFKVASGIQMAKYLNNTNYTFYIKNDEGKDFLVQEFFGEPIGAMNRVAFHESINASFERKFNKTLPLLLIGTSEDIIINNIDLFIISDIPHVYFSTIKRLNELPFNEALFKIMTDGSIYSFSKDFKNIIQTQKLSKK